jgi:hypothetical protein
MLAEWLDPPPCKTCRARRTCQTRKTCRAREIDRAGETDKLIVPVNPAR